MKMNEEVGHVRATVGEQEDTELELMERQEALESDLARLGRELAAARERTAAAAPELQERLERLEGELEDVERERQATWEEIPADWQQAYLRVRSRQPDPGAEAVGGHGQAFRAAGTSSGTQALGRGALVYCDNRGTITARARRSV